MASSCRLNVITGMLLDYCGKHGVKQAVLHKTVRISAKRFLQIDKNPFSSITHSSWKALSSSSTVRSSDSSDVPSSSDVSVVYRRGFPVITIPLPSRREKCHFTLRPVTHTVGDFLQHVCHEDHGIDRIGVKTLDGVRISSSTTIESLLQDDFHLIINDMVYHVCPPATERLTAEQMQTLSHIRHLISVLNETLNVDEHQVRKERELLQRLEELQTELEPMEQKRRELALWSSRRTSMISWIGLGLMATQFGVLARLTWWEYSWDIMEPVTYFVTYGTTMACYAYFVLTKQDYILPDVRDRQFLITFYKQAKKIGLDVDRYNQLKDLISTAENDISRLRDPLRLHLPHSLLRSNRSKSSNLGRQDAEADDLQEDRKQNPEVVNNIPTDKIIR